MRKINLDEQFKEADVRKLEDIVKISSIPVRELNGKGVVAVWDLNEKAKQDAVFRLDVTIEGKKHELYFFKSHFQNFLRAV